jgi:shikimate kinase|tara:strand:+ start:517 stop:1116 length:600 start_codon:yes stop_codon:yes gene_type:complete
LHIVQDALKLGMMPEISDQQCKSRCQNIVLVGFMGCGKSTVGREIGLQLNYPLVDTDTLIEESVGMSVAQIFSQHGEGYFRDLETDLISQIYSKDFTKQIISTGGGLPLREQNRERLRKLGYVVWLQASADTVLERTAKSNHRPLINNQNPKEKIETMLVERDPIYADVADLTINTDDLEISETVHGIIESANYHFSKS